MSNLFKRTAIFTDIHFGNKSNSVSHNQDCLDFVQWAIRTAQEHNCDTGMFLGDWHHHRASINVSTLNYSLQSLELLAQAFGQFFFIPGNHDLYYRDKRDVQSAEWARNIKGITIVNDFFQEGDVSIVPWLVGDDHKTVKKIQAKHMFGHFELPHFYMNAMVQMPDHGELKTEELQGVEQVWSGHFHKRQSKNNVTYIGNAFPHNYADAWDDERGLLILDWDGTQKYIAWPDAPRYRTLKLSQLLDNPDQYLTAKTYARVNLDIDISYEEANFIKENFVAQYQLRDLTLIPVKNQEHDTEYTGDINFESVDTIVTSQLSQVESEFYDPKLLMEIYRNL